MHDCPGCDAAMSLRIHKPYILYDDGDHKFVWLGLDESEAEKGILANQYMVVDSGHGLLIDPGGYYVFQRVLENVSEFIDPARVDALFFSHQDPDVIGSLNILLDVFPDATIYISELWVRFIPHLGALDIKRIKPIPDQGMDIVLGKTTLKAIPAHFLHSPGNFHLYDPASKILFTGDLGAAVFPPNTWYLFVEDFDSHAKLMEGFHRRYLPCRRPLDKWLETIRGLDIRMIVPQHGAIMEEDKAEKFLKWLEGLGEIGVEHMEK